MSPKSHSPNRVSMRGGRWSRALARLVRHDSTAGVAERLYGSIVAQARRAEFYEQLAVPDSLDGRFEMLALHLFLVLHRLQNEPAMPARLGRRLVEHMVADLDANLREMGAGDLGVGRRVKAMAAGFYGRVAAYATGLGRNQVELEAAIRRNVYGTVEPLPEQVEAMADYVRACSAALATLPAARLGAGTLRFPDPGGGVIGPVPDD